MAIILKKNETLEDIVALLRDSFNVVKEIAPVAYWYEHLYENGRIKDIHFSNRMREMLGYKSIEEFPDELNTLMTYTHPDDVHIMLDDAILAGTGKIDKYDVEYRLRMASGDYKWCNATGVLVKDHEGKTVGMYGSFVDIDSKKAKEEAMKLVESYENVLSSEFKVMYFINLTEGKATFIHGDEEAKKFIPIFNTNSVDAIIANFHKMYVDVAVVEDDREKVKSVMNTDNIYKVLHDHNSISVNYRVRRNLVDPVYTEMRIFKAGESDGYLTSIILSFRPADEEISHALRVSQELQEEVMREMLDVDGLFLVDCEKDTRKTIRDKSHSNEITDEEKHSVSFERYINTFVYEEDREKMRDAIRPLTMLERLKRENEYKVEYREITTGVPVYFEMRLMRFSDTEVLQGFRQCDQEVQYRHVTEKLMDEYDALYIVDLSKDTIWSARSSRVSKVGNFKGVVSYKQLVRKFAQTVVPEYQQDWLLFSDVDYMRQYMAEDEHREYIYELPGTKRLMRRFTVDVLERVDGVASTLLLSFVGIDDERAQTIRLHKQMAAQKHLLDYFIKSYESAYIVDLEKDSFEVLHMNHEFSKVYGSFGEDKIGMSRFIEKHVHPDDRAMIRQLTDKNYLTNRLRHESSITFTMREVFGKVEKSLRGMIVRIDDEYHVAVGFEDITEELAVQQMQQMNNKLIDQMMGDDGLFLIDCKNDTRKTIHDRCDGADSYDDDNGYKKSIRQYVENCVVEQDREMMRKVTSPAYMLKHTKKEREYSVDYRDVSTGVKRYYRMRIARFSDTEVLQSFRECDEEVMGRIVRDKLIDEYDALYILDLDKNEIRPARPSRVTDVGVFNKRINYHDVAMRFAGIVDPQYHDDWVRFSDVEYMKEYMASEDHREFVYVLPGIKNSLRRFTVDVLERADGAASTLLLSFMGIDDLRAETILLHTQLADQANQLEDALKVANEEVRRTDLLYDAINSGKWSYKIDEDGNVVDGIYQNKADETLHLVYDDKPLGWMEHLHPEDRENVDNAFWATVNDRSGHTPYDVSFRMVADDGKITWIKSSGRLLCFEDGTAEFIGLSINITDQIEEQEKQQQQLQEAYDTAVFANQAKTVFMNNMSHDIRTPMNAIIGYTAMAQKNLDNKRLVEEYLGKIGVAGNTLLALVNQVLDMSRIEAGKITLTEEEADIVERAYEMAEIMHHSAAAKNIRVKTIIDQVRNRKIYADSGRVNQVMLNILGNAVKYTPEYGKITYTVSQKECSEPGYATYTLCIEDNGIGMSKNYINKIFEPFSRENTSTVSQIQGTGLGMSIVKKLVDMMGGSIDIQSELGKGTKVTVTLTFRLHEDDKGTVAKAKPEVVETEDFSILSGKHILLVEDNEMNREIATVILEEHDMIVETASDGYIAVEMLHKRMEDGTYNHFDAVLMDIQMPRMNGYEAAHAIREMEGSAAVHVKHLPIIALSANAFEEDKQKSREAGMDDHIAKPIDVPELMHTLAKFLR